jgi:hypothetical protein
MPLGSEKVGLLGAAGSATGGNRAVFCGGEGANPSASRTNVVDYINIATTMNATDFGDYGVTVTSIGGESNGSNDRGVYGGGSDPSGSTNVMNYFTISAASYSSTDFGDLTAATTNMRAASNKTDERLVWVSGERAGPVRTNILEYVTINSPGNATDFGDLTVPRRSGGADSNGTSDRGIYAGGFGTVPTPTNWNTIDYWTITSTGNATDFGDLINCQGGQVVAAVSNLTNDRVCFSGGNRQTVSPCSGSGNIISYVTITSTGNSTDFGDLAVNTGANTGTSNGTEERGITAGDAGSGSNTIQYFTINSTGNASDFGDLSRGRQRPAAASDAG